MNSAQQRGRLFKKGESGNPNGRPSKGYSISEMMKEMLANDPDVKRQLGQTIIEKAKAGDMNAIKLVWQYMDGMPTQAIDANLTHQGGITVISKVPQPHDDSRAGV